MLLSLSPDSERKFFSSVEKIFKCDSEKGLKLLIIYADYNVRW